MLKDITKKYPFNEEKSINFKVFAFAINENRPYIQKLKEKMGYTGAHIFAEKSLFLWMASDTHISNHHFGIISRKYKSKKLLYWTTKDVIQTLENPTFFTSIEEVFSKAYLDYLMLTLEGRKTVWYGPKPELFLEDGK